MVVLTTFGRCADLDHELLQAQDIDRGLADGGRRLGGVGAAVDAGVGLDLDDVDPSVDGKGQHVLLQVDRLAAEVETGHGVADEVIGLGRVGEHLFDALASKPRPQLIHPGSGHAGVCLPQRGGGQIVLADLGDLEAKVTASERRRSRPSHWPPPAARTGCRG